MCSELQPRTNNSFICLLGRVGGDLQKKKKILFLFVYRPVDLSILVEVLQAFQHVLQHSGDGGLVQDAGLVFPSGDDVFDHVQHGAWILTTRARIQKKKPHTQKQNPHRVSGCQH